MPVVFHNLAGYDAHLFIRELAKYTTGMGIIAKNTEDYISFSIKVEVDKYVDKEGNERMKEMELRFTDSVKGHVKIMLLPVIALSFPHFCPKLEQTSHIHQEQHS